MIESKTEVLGTDGEATETWAVHKAQWRGRVNPMKAAEGYEAGQNVPRITHEVTIRYLSTLTENMRLLFKGRYLYIAGIKKPEERNIQQVLECYETI